MLRRPYLDFSHRATRGAHYAVDPSFDDAAAEIAALRDSIRHGNSIGDYDMLASASSDIAATRKEH